MGFLTGAFQQLYINDDNDFILQTRQGIGVGRTLGTVVEEKLYFWEAAGVPQRVNPFLLWRDFRNRGPVRDRLDFCRFPDDVFYRGQKRGHGTCQGKDRHGSILERESRKWKNHTDPDNFCKEAIVLALASGING